MGQSLGRSQEYTGLFRFNVLAAVGQDCVRPAYPFLIT